MITRPGGYCPMCDTVYDRPHECVGKSLETKMDTNNKNLGDTKKGYAIARDSVYVKEIWNEAIEAAALAALETSETADIAIPICTAIRKLNK